MIIYLQGYMGSGKTTVGKALAAELGYLFVDTDELITSLEGKDIHDIFDSNGEAYFRDLEFRVLDDIQHLGNAVIATGGGLPCSDHNYSIIRNSGISVYLQTSPRVLATRLTSENDRPLIQSVKQDLLSFIKRHLKERETYYEKSNFTVNGDLPVKEIVAEILSQLT